MHVVSGHVTSAHLVTAFHASVHTTGDVSMVTDSMYPWQGRSHLRGIDVRQTAGGSTMW